MLFNSPAFLFVYLPVVLAGFFVLGRFQIALAAFWAALASLVFYGWDDPWRLVPLILCSIAFNFAMGRLISTSRSLAMLWVGLAGNLALLGWFKYAGFISSNLFAAGVPISPLDIALPIGISFFTFTQIAFLVDAYRGEAKEYNIIHYILFVTYFPHLIAGPILHHKEMMPQFARPSTYRFNADDFSVGVSWFAFGLFKKVMLADNIAVYADAAFKQSSTGAISIADAWLGTLSYTLQLYFDFSGYSDMAIGLALMMGIRFPLNFNSPYKARSLVDFWRRWHMTLSRFLRDYLYIPLGGNRRGPLRRHINLFITMVLGGLWHGASWNFVLWGAIHGAGLIVNHFWSTIEEGLGWRLPAGLAWALTLLVVVLAWVPFRASDLHATTTVWTAMGGGSSAVSVVPTLGWIWVAALGAIALFAPNTGEIFRKGDVGNFLWRPSIAWSIAVGSAIGLSMVSSLVNPSAFLYFRF